MTALPAPAPARDLLRRHRTLAICAALFLAAQIAFLPGLSKPAEPYFDETHYVAAARAVLAGGETANREHPPFAKGVIAVSIALLGDRPLGWRYPSVLFGTLALVGIYLWARQLFAEERAALWAAGATLVNQMLYVQARLAMLDVFMTAFIIWALFFFSASWQAGAVRRCFAACGLCLGFAAACKWPGLLVWLMIADTVLLVLVLQHWHVRFADPRAEDWYRPDLWREMRLWHWLLSLGALPLAVYLLTFVPSEGMALGKILHRQIEMWEAMARVPAAHPYLSSWMDWPILRRPIWYLFTAEPGSERIQAVMLLGNPLLLWAGLPAVLACLKGWLGARRRAPFIIAASALALYLPWAVVPKAGGFFYYYFPTAMVLSLALAYLFYETRLGRWRWPPRLFLLAALGAFLYFLPITSAAVGVTLPGYGERMWLSGWP